MPTRWLTRRAQPPRPMGAAALFAGGCRRPPPRWSGHRCQRCCASARRRGGDARRPHPTSDSSRHSGVRRDGRNARRRACPRPSSRIADAGRRQRRDGGRDRRSADRGIAPVGGWDRGAAAPGLRDDRRSGGAAAPTAGAALRARGRPAARPGLRPRAGSGADGRAEMRQRVTAAVGCPKSAASVCRRQRRTAIPMAPEVSAASCNRRGAVGDRRATSATTARSPP